MIDFLIGACELGKPGELIVQCGSFGLSLACSASAIDAFASKQGEQKVYTKLSISEAGAVLYGFIDKNEREMFEHLISVSKVGPKAALSILSRYAPGRLATIISQGDSKSLSAAPGIGKKLAESIIFSLRDRFSDGDGGMFIDLGASEGLDLADPKTQAQLALESLGFDPAQAVRMVKASYVEGISAEELIRTALQS